MNDWSWPSQYLRDDEQPAPVRRHRAERRAIIEESYGYYLRQLDLVRQWIDLNDAIEGCPRCGASIAISAERQADRQAALLREKRGDRRTMRQIPCEAEFREKHYNFHAAELGRDLVVW